MSNLNFKTPSRRSGQTMIALLVVVVIMIGLTLAFLGSRRGADGEMKPSIAKASIDRSQEVLLQSNVGQIQQFIGMYKSDNDGKPPADLAEVKRASKFPLEMFVNPVDQQPLDYDAAAGTMIVKPYEGMSAMIAKMNANPTRSTDQAGAPPVASAPGAPVPAAPPAMAPGTGPGGVRMPAIPNSGSAPADDSQ